MKIDVRWHDPNQTIILVNFYEGWTTGDFRAAREAIIQLALTVEHAICVIMDATGTHVPSDFIAYAGDLTRQGPRPMMNVALYVIVTPNRLIQTMYHAFLRVQGAGLFTNRLTLAETQEKALALTQERLAQISS